jgi:hypothetical protein
MKLSKIQIVCCSTLFLSGLICPLRRIYLIVSNVHDGEHQAGTSYSLIDNSLDAIQTHLQGLHGRTITESNEMVTWTIEQISSLTWVQVKEDTGHNDDTFLKTSLEEVETITDCLG